MRPTAPSTTLTVIGISSVVLGGLVAAVTGPLDLEQGSWLAAYLVLVTGVAQCAMGVARLGTPPPRQAPPWAWAQVAGWNLGSALVIAGSLASQPRVVDLGSMLLVAALVIALHATREAAFAPWLRWTYRMLLLILAVSIPVGMVLAHLRHG